MFHGSCRKVSKVLSMALEPISKSAVHYLARKVSEIRVAKEPRYRWAFERLGLEYKHERFGLRNRVERFFRYLKERTAVFHHKLSARNDIQGITNLKLFLTLFTLYYQAARTGR
jgi:transposase-like protein